MHSDEKFDSKYFKTVRIQDKKVRDEKLRELNIYIISERVPRSLVTNHYNLSSVVAIREKLLG